MLPSLGPQPMNEPFDVVVGRCTRRGVELPFAAAIEMVLMMGRYPSGQSFVAYVNNTDNQPQGFARPPNFRNGWNRPPAFDRRPPRN